jgi:uncharacterized protein (TIGR03545 family)
MFRWKGLILIAILIGIFIILSLIFTDRWLENKLENIGTSIVGAKVEIDALDFSFYGLHFRWKRLQVTNPGNTWKNMIETGKCEFNMEFWPLLSKKVIIENIQLSNFRTGTDRTSDGKIIKKEKAVKEKKKEEPTFISKTIDNLEDKIKAMPQFQLAQYARKMNIDSIIKILDLKTPGKADSLRKALTQKYSDWQTNLKKLELEKEYKTIESKAKSINVNNIKTIENLQSNLKKVEEIRTSVDDLTKVVQNNKRNLLADLKSFKNELQQVDDWIKNDFERAMDMAKIPKIDIQNIGIFIFGKRVITQLNQYLGYANKARYYASKVKSDKPEKEPKPPRMKGQNIYFYNKNARPDFWIQKIDLSGQTEDNIQLAGLATNIVSDQRFIGKTTDIAIKGSKETAATVSLDAIFDYLTDTPAEKFDAQYSGFSIANTKLSDSPFLPNKLAKGKGSVYASLDLIGDRIDSQIKFLAQRLEWDFKNAEKPKNKIEEIIQSIVKRIETVDFTARIYGKKDNIKFTLKSNLDEIFIKSIKEIAAKEIEQAKKKLRAEVEKRVEKYKKQVEQLIKEKQDMLQSQIKKYEGELNKKKKMVEDKKKEIEKRIEDEKAKLQKKLDQEKSKAEKKIKKEADDQIKKLFK